MGFAGLACLELTLAINVTILVKSAIRMLRVPLVIQLLLFLLHG